MDHDEARMLVSARVDGELDASDAAHLEEHLAACAECRAFAAALPRLGTLAAALPQETAPPVLELRVAERIAAPRKVRLRTLGLRLSPALAAALVIAILIVQLGPGTFQVPAAAADALTRIHTLYVDREIDQRGPDGHDRYRERIWFKEPGLVRIERTRIEGALPDELEIRRPGETYLRGGGLETRTTGLPPDPNALPEPLSPVVALVGKPAGPGPRVAGRPTTRVVFRISADLRQEALVDARRFTVLGFEESGVVLGKVTEGTQIRRKRTRAIRYNPPVPDRLFDIPRITAKDEGFRSGRLAPGQPASAATPKGFARVSAGSYRGGNVLLYAKGAFPIAVWTGPATPDSTQLERRVPVSIGPTAGVLVLQLYALPRVEFAVDGVRVAVSAPLPPRALAQVAAEMFPRRE